MADNDSTHELGTLGDQAATSSFSDTHRLVSSASHAEEGRSESISSSLFNKDKLKGSYHKLTGNYHDGEHKKYVIREGFRPVLSKIWIHTIPLAAIIPIATLNILKYYIGPQFAGSMDAAAQNLSNLGLQVAAKLFELLVATSLGLTVMDILRYMLLYDSEGLPLGILRAQQSFSSLEYLWSVEFWSGRKGLTKTWHKWLIPLYIIVVGVIMVLIGPSAALLIIPKTFDDYPAGGSQFWVVGSSSDLWPDTIDGRALLPGCLSPTVENITSPSINSSACPWHGYSGIFGIYEQWRTIQGAWNDAPVELEDNGFKRQIQQHRGISGIGLDSWAVATDFSISIWSALLTGAWNSALGLAPRLSRFHNYEYMDRRGTAAAVLESANANLPTVRTACETDVNADYARTQFKYPILHLFQTYEGIEDTFFLTSETTSKENETVITAQWLPIPDGESETNLPSGIKTTEYPSALFQIRVPRPAEDTGLQTVLSCSVDARWAPGIHRLGLIMTGEDYHYPEVTHLRDPKEGLTEDQIANSNQAAFGFLPADDGSWRTVSLGLDWLNALTPQMDPENQFRNTATYILEAMRIDNTTGGVQDWGHLHRFAESLISTMVVDGMSRIGLRFNDLQPLDYPVAAINPAFNVTTINDDARAQRSIVRGNGDAISPPPNTSPANRTELTWSVTITGLAYRADNTASKLALALIFTYAAIAITHIIWTLARRQTSTSWSSPLELILLGQSSPPAPHVLQNTSAGIKDSATYAKTARIRLVQGYVERPEEEEVQLLWEKGDYVEESRYRKIQVGRRYGAIGGRA